MNDSVSGIPRVVICGVACVLLQSALSFTIAAESFGRESVNFPWSNTLCARSTADTLQMPRCFKNATTNSRIGPGTAVRPACA
jgi:hypothetical protein